MRTMTTSPHTDPLTGYRRLALLLAPFDGEERTPWVDSTGDHQVLSEEGRALARCCRDEAWNLRALLLRQGESPRDVDLIGLSLEGLLQEKPEAAEMARSIAQLAWRVYSGRL